MRFFFARDHKDMHMETNQQQNFILIDGKKINILQIQTTYKHGS